MSVIITGWNTTIAQEFLTFRPGDDQCFRGSTRKGRINLQAERYLFCQGFLLPKRSDEMTIAEGDETMRANCYGITEACDRIIEANDYARICVIGSESGYRGSYNSTYAQAKAMLHHYVTQKRLRTPHQQLVAISPDIIEDSGMTRRREDIENLDRRRREHPKGRFLTALEVAKMAITLLYHQPYISGTVIRMHGGRQ